MSPPGGRTQPDDGPGGRLAPGPGNSRVDDVIWNEKPVGLMKLGDNPIFQICSDVIFARASTVFQFRVVALTDRVFSIALFESFVRPYPLGQ